MGRDSFDYYVQSSPSILRQDASLEDHLLEDHQFYQNQKNRWTRADRLRQTTFENRLRVLDQKKRTRKFRNITIAQIEQQPVFNEDTVHEFIKDHQQTTPTPPTHITTRGKQFVTQLLKKHSHHDDEAEHNKKRRRKRKKKHQDFQIKKTLWYQLIYHHAFRDRLQQACLHHALLLKFREDHLSTFQKVRERLQPTERDHFDVYRYIKRDLYAIIRSWVIPTTTTSTTRKKTNVMLPEDYEKERLWKLRQGNIKVRFEDPQKREQAIITEEQFFVPMMEPLLVAWWDAIPQGHKDASDMGMDTSTFQQLYALMLCILVPDGNMYARDTKIASFFKTKHATPHANYVARYDFYKFLYHFCKHWVDSTTTQEAHSFLSVMLRECTVIATETGMHCLTQPTMVDSCPLPPLIRQFPQKNDPTTSDVITQPLLIAPQPAQPDMTERATIHPSQESMKRLAQSINASTNMIKDQHGFVQRATVAHDKLKRIHDHPLEGHHLPPIRGVNLDDEIRVYREHQRYTEAIPRRGLPLL